MLSPFLTVVVLVVLWLIVVVPMVLRRSDERRRERTVASFGRGMRALGRRNVPAESAEVFTPRRPSPTSAPVAPVATAGRRPVPAAQEALMYPPDRSDLSPARAQMLARRRRSLTTLVAGSILFGIAAYVMGGAMWWVAAPFLLGLVGYMFFLRSQALRDRSRRENRQLRAAARRPAGYDATTDLARFEPDPPTVVRIDDDDIELHSMDTIDLTGLYQEEAAAPAVQRRAS